MKALLTCMLHKIKGRVEQEDGSMNTKSLKQLLVVSSLTKQFQSRYLISTKYLLRKTCVVLSLMS